MAYLSTPHRPMVRATPERQARAKDFPDLSLVLLSAASLSAEALAAILGQSVDCVKLIGVDGSVRWMNANGLCAMEIDDFDVIRGQQWEALWPEDGGI